MLDKIKLNVVWIYKQAICICGSLFSLVAVVTYAVFRDSSMANDSVATNFEQIFATYSPETVRKVL